MMPDVKMPMIHCEKCGEYHSTFYRCPPSVASASTVKEVPTAPAPVAIKVLTLVEYNAIMDRLARLEHWLLDQESGK